MRFSIIVIAVAMMTACNSPEADSADSSPKKTDTVATNTSDTSKAADNTLSDEERTAGFELLFDGKSKEGFHVFNGKTDGSAWRIDNGSLHLDPREEKDAQTVGGGDLLSKDEYQNFHLKLDWKVDTAGNSGILLYVKEDKKYERSWHTGLEMQVLDNERHPDSKIKKHRAGDLYDLITSSPETVKPALEWNHVEIVSSNGKLEFSLNGTRVVSTTLWDDNWKTLIKGSKFEKWSDFGTFKSGRIGLQDHGNKVWFKNIKIMKL
jgi:3-keto-disaccharide hydrolase